MEFRTTFIILTLIGSIVYLFCASNIPNNGPIYNQLGIYLMTIFAAITFGICFIILWRRKWKINHRSLSIAHLIALIFEASRWGMLWGYTLGFNYSKTYIIWAIFDQSLSGIVFILRQYYIGLPDKKYHDEQLPDFKFSNQEPYILSLS